MVWERLRSVILQIQSRNHMVKPSNFHNNMRWHNLIVYDINDKFLQNYSKYLKCRLVDLGCGEAPYKKYFLQFVDKYTGVDWSNTLHNSKIDIYIDWKVETQGYFVVAKKNEIFYLK